MPYRNRLNRWIIVRLLPNMQRIVVARFYKRCDADGHLQVVRRLVPDGQFEIVFDCNLKPDC